MWVLEERASRKIVRIVTKIHTENCSATVSGSHWIRNGRQARLVVQDSLTLSQWAANLFKSHILPLHLKAILLQSLLSHPLSSAKQFPSFFPQLPKGVNRMPRMGGWEEEPPPPNDPRLGSENLTKNYVPTQKPFEIIISLNPAGSLLTSLGDHADHWIQERDPLLYTTSPEAFQIHTISISEHKNDHSLALEKNLVCKPEEDLLSSAWTSYLANWMNLAIESCQGDASAKQNLPLLVVGSASAKL